jgi:hypothetical protein
MLSCKTYNWLERSRGEASAASVLSVPSFSVCASVLGPMRRFLSFLMASAILLAGLALAGFEIIRAEGVRPFVLFGALVMVVISGVWLLEEFVLPRWRS